jgi:hypothetical protein
MYSIGLLLARLVCQRCCSVHRDIRPPLRANNHPKGHPARGWQNGGSKSNKYATRIAELDFNALGKQQRDAALQDVSGNDYVNPQ